MNSSDPIAAQRPTSIVKRPIKVSFGKLLQTVGKGAIDFGFLNWSGAAKDSLEIVQALGLGQDVTEILWLLVQRSLIKAMVDLTRSQDTVLNPDRKLDLKKLSEVLDARLVASDVTLDRDFFSKPERLPIIEDLKIPYGQWLQDYIVIDKNGRPITPAQEQLMIVAMAKSISDRLPTYFVYALNREWVAGKETYKILEEQLKTPISKAEERERAWENYTAWLQKQIDEPLFGLEAFSLKQIYVNLRAYYHQEKKSEKRGDELKLERVVVDLQTELESWVNKAAKDDAIRIISGAPGCGKSSFTKIFASHISSSLGIKVLFIPLHQFEPSKDLVDALDKFIGNDLDEILPPNPLKKENMPSRLLLIFDGLDELAMQGKIAAKVAEDFVTEIKNKIIPWNHNHIHVQILISGREVVVQANSSQFRHFEQVLHVLPYFETEETLKKHEYIDSQNILRRDQRQEWWQKYGSLTGRNYLGLPSELANQNLNEITAQPLLNYLVALSFTGGNLDFSQENNLNSIYDDLLASIFKRDWEKRQHKAIDGNITLDHFVRILEEIAIACWHGNGRTTTVTEIESHCKDSGLEKMLEVFWEGTKVGVDLSGRDLSGRDLSMSHLIEANLAQANLSRAILSKTFLIGANLTQANLSEALLYQSFLTQANFNKANLSNTILIEVDFSNVNLSNAILSNANLREVNFSNANLSNADLSNAILTEVDFSNANLSNAILTEVDFSNTDLSNADLRNAILNKVDFSNANLSNADLRNANLNKVDFSNANLSNADLRNTISREVNLSNANLRNAILKEVDFSNTDLSNADLSNDILNNAILTGRTILEGATYDASY